MLVLFWIIAFEIAPNVLINHLDVLSTFVDFQPEGGDLCSKPCIIVIIFLNFGEHVLDVLAIPLLHVLLALLHALDLVAEPAVVHRGLLLLECLVAVRGVLLGTFLRLRRGGLLAQVGVLGRL